MSRRTGSSDQLLEEIKGMMMEGREFIRYQRDAKPSRILLYLKAGLGEALSEQPDSLSAPFPSPRPQSYSLIWVDPSMKDHKHSIAPTHTSQGSIDGIERNSVPLEEVSELSLGRQSSVLAQQASATKEDRCFSIAASNGVNGGASNRDGSAFTLELEAVSENLRVSWVYGLTALLKLCGVPYKLRPGRSRTSKSPARHRATTPTKTKEASFTSPTAKSANNNTMSVDELNTTASARSPQNINNSKYEEEKQGGNLTSSFASPNPSPVASKFLAASPSNNSSLSLASPQHSSTSSLPYTIATANQIPNPDLVYEISVKCRFLRRIHYPSTSSGAVALCNPIVCVFVSENMRELEHSTPANPVAVKFKYLEQTELIKANNNPVFRKKFHLSPHNLSLSLKDLHGAIAKFSVYDISGEVIHEEDRCGSSDIKLWDLISEKGLGLDFVYELTHPDANSSASSTFASTSVTPRSQQNQAMIILKAEKKTVQEVAAARAAMKAAAASQAQLQQSQQQVASRTPSKYDEAARNRSSPLRRDPRSNAAPDYNTANGTEVPQLLHKVQRMMMYGRSFMRYTPDGAPPSEYSIFYRTGDAIDVKDPVNHAGFIYWAPAGRRDEDPNRRIPLTKVTDVTLGKSARSFSMPAASGAAEDRCFSIVGVNGFSLDLEASTVKQCVAWAFGIMSLLKKDPSLTSPTATSSNSYSTSLNAPANAASINGASSVGPRSSSSSITPSSQSIQNTLISPSAQQQPGESISPGGQPSTSHAAPVSDQVAQSAGAPSVSTRGGQMTFTTEITPPAEVGAPAQVRQSRRGSFTIVSNAPVDLSQQGAAQYVQQQHAYNQSHALPPADSAAASSTSPGTTGHFQFNNTPQFLQAPAPLPAPPSPADNSKEAPKPSFAVTPSAHVAEKAASLYQDSAQGAHPVVPQAQPGPVHPLIRPVHLSDDELLRLAAVKERLSKGVAVMRHPDLTTHVLFFEAEIANADGAVIVPPALHLAPLPVIQDADSLAKACNPQEATSSFDLIRISAVYEGVQTSGFWGAESRERDGPLLLQPNAEAKRAEQRRDECSFSMQVEPPSSAANLLGAVGAGTRRNMPILYELELINASSSQARTEWIKGLELLHKAYSRPFSPRLHIEPSVKAMQIYLGAIHMHSTMDPATANPSSLLAANNAQPQSGFLVLLSQKDAETGSTVHLDQSEFIPLQNIGGVLPTDFKLAFNRNFSLNLYNPAVNAAQEVLLELFEFSSALYHTQIEPSFGLVPPAKWNRSLYLVGSAALELSAVRTSVNAGKELVVALVNVERREVGYNLALKNSSIILNGYPPHTGGLFAPHLELPALPSLPTLPSLPPTLPPAQSVSGSTTPLPGAPDSPPIAASVRTLKSTEDEKQPLNAAAPSAALGSAEELKGWSKFANESPLNIPAVEKHDFACQTPIATMASGATQTEPDNTGIIRQKEVEVRTITMERPAGAAEQRTEETQTTPRVGDDPIMLLGVPDLTPRKPDWTPRKPAAPTTSAGTSPYSDPASSLPPPQISPRDQALIAKAKRAAVEAAAAFDEAKEVTEYNERYLWTDDSTHSVPHPACLGTNGLLPFPQPGGIEIGMGEMVMKPAAQSANKPLSESKEPEEAAMSAAKSEKAMRAIAHWKKVANYIRHASSPSSESLLADKPMEGGEFMDVQVGDFVRVFLSVRAEGLFFPKADKMIESVVGCYHVDPSRNKFDFVSHTDRVQESLSPAFNRAVELMLVGGAPSMYTLSLYDVHSSREARESCRLGSAFFFLDNHVHYPEKEFTYYLSNSNSLKWHDLLVQNKARLIVKTIDIVKVQPGEDIHNLKIHVPLGSPKTPAVRNQSSGNMVFNPMTPSSGPGANGGLMVDPSTPKPVPFAGGAPQAQSSNGSTAAKQGLPPPSPSTGSGSGSVFISPVDRMQQLNAVNESHDGDHSMLFGSSVQGALMHQASFGAHSPDLDFEIPLLIPALLRNIVDAQGHKAEGIFRVSPPSASLDPLVTELEDGNYGLEEPDCHTNAALLKLWLRKMKSPIIPTKFYNAMIAVGRAPAFDMRNESDKSTLQSILGTLDGPNAKSLLTLMLFARLIIAHEDENRMSAKALGVVLAPSLVRMPEEEANAPGGPLKEAGNANAAALFVERLIQATPGCFPQGKSTIQAAATVIQFLFPEDDLSPEPVASPTSPTELVMSPTAAAPESSSSAPAAAVAAPAAASATAPAHAAPAAEQAPQSSSAPVSADAVAAAAVASPGAPDAEHHDAEPALFGTSVAGALAHQASFGAHSPDLDSEVPLVIPALLRNIIDNRGHKTDGLFKVNAPSSTLDALQAELEDGNYGLDEPNPHANGGLLKRWLRSLSEPIIPFDQYDALVAIGRRADFDVASNAALFHPITSTLSSPNAKSLLTLLLFLQRIASFSSANRMNERALGEVWGPILLRKKDETAQKPADEVAAAVACVERLIRSAPNCFHNASQIKIAADSVILFLFPDESGAGAADAASAPVASHAAPVVESAPQSSSAPDAVAAASPVVASPGAPVDPLDPEPALFGTSISGALAHQASFGAHSPDLDSEVPLVIPALLRNIIDNRGHKTDGLFKVNPPSSTLDALQAELEDGNYGLDEPNPHANAGLLKRWLRGLSEPIIPFSQYDAMIDIGRRGNFDTTKDATLLHPITSSLSSPNAKSLLTLLLFLQRIASFSSANRMNEHALAEVWGPILLRKKDEAAQKPADETAASVAFLERLIHSAPNCFQNAAQLKSAADSVLLFLFPDEPAAADATASAAAIAVPTELTPLSPVTAQGQINEAAFPPLADAHEDRPIKVSASPLAADEAAAPAPAASAVTAPAALSAPAADATSTAVVAASSAKASPEESPRHTTAVTYYPDPSLPLETQLQLMQNHLLVQMLRGDVTFRFYDSADGTLIPNSMVAYRVPTNPNPCIDPLDPVENKQGGLVWSTDQGATWPAEHSIKLLEIKKIIDGKVESKTWELGQAKSMATPNCCFTIVSKTRTLDLEAASPRQKLEWIYGVRVLMGAIGRGPKATVAPLLKPQTAAASK